MTYTPTRSPKIAEQLLLETLPFFTHIFCGRQAPGFGAHHHTLLILIRCLPYHEEQPDRRGRCRWGWGWGWGWCRSSSAQSRLLPCFVVPKVHLFGMPQKLRRVRGWISNSFAIVSVCVYTHACQPDTAYTDVSRFPICPGDAMVVQKPHRHRCSRSLSLTTGKAGSRVSLDANRHPNVCRARFISLARE